MKPLKTDGYSLQSAGFRMDIAGSDHYFGFEADLICFCKAIAIADEAFAALCGRHYYEYLVGSEAFSRRNFYIINAREDNFKHLTGVNSGLPPRLFFEKCINGTLSENDFDFIKDGQDERTVKGTVRRKIKALPDMMELLKDGLPAEENFKKNRVICSFAAADSNCTLGFVDTGKARPKSLIRGNELKHPKPVELLLRRKCGKEFFDEIIIGGNKQIDKYKEAIESVVSAELLNRQIPE